MKYSRDSDYNQHRSVQSLLLNDYSTIIKDIGKFMRTEPCLARGHVDVIQHERALAPCQ